MVEVKKDKVEGCDESSHPTGQWIPWGKAISGPLWTDRKEIPVVS
jgi:hypothetical protein